MRNPWKKFLNKIILSGSERASRSRVKKVEITEQDLKNQWQKQDGKCYWLDIPLNIDDVYTTKNPFAPSADRLNNDEDYTVNNTVICCAFVNMGRGVVDKAHFRLFIEYLKHFIRHSEK